MKTENERKGAQRVLDEKNHKKIKSTNIYIYRGNCLLLLFPFFLSSHGILPSLKIFFFFSPTDALQQAHTRLLCLHLSILPPPLTDRLSEKGGATVQPAEAVVVVVRPSHSSFPSFRDVVRPIGGGMCCLK